MINVVSIDSSQREREREVEEGSNKNNDRCTEVYDNWRGEMTITEHQKDRGDG